MRRLVNILSVLVLSMGIMPARVNAGPSGAEAFEKLKTLVGHWRRTRPTRPRPLWTWS